VVVAGLIALGVVLMICIVLVVQVHDADLLPVVS
jgi:hypothetical protein